MNKPLILAEIGVNHEGSLDKAKQMIFECRGLAWGVKFQAYKADKLASKYAKAYWDTTKTQNEYFKEYDSFTVEDYKELSRYAKENKLAFVMTCFDTDTLRELVSFVDYFKVASSDITNYPLLDAIAETEKPVIVSTGGANHEEILQAIYRLKNPLSMYLLHCVVKYPTKTEEANLERILELKKYGKKVGYSDHTIPNQALLVDAWLLGATMIEKHYTFDKTLPGNDHYHSMDCLDLKVLNHYIDHHLEWLKGDNLPEYEARRSLFYKTDLKAGELLGDNNVIALRPGTFMPANKIDHIIGKKLLRDVKQGEPVVTLDYTG